MRRGASTHASGRQRTAEGHRRRRTAPISKVTTSPGRRRCSSSSRSERLANCTNAKIKRPLSRRGDRPSFQKCACASWALGVPRCRPEVGATKAARNVMIQRATRYTQRHTQQAAHLEAIDRAQELIRLDACARTPRISRQPELMCSAHHVPRGETVNSRAKLPTQRA